MAITALLAFASALFTAALCSRAEGLGKSAKLISEPDGYRRLHARPTPLVGGLAILAPVYLISIGYSWYQPLDPRLVALLCASSLMLVVGFVDDRVAISPVWRLFALCVIAFTVLQIEPSFVLHRPRLWLLEKEYFLQLDPIGATATVLMLMGFVNAANMADGINGQLIGSVLIWSALIMRHESGANALPFILLACSALAALPFNLKGRLFCGSAGAYALSTLIGLAAIASYREGGSQHAELPVFWFWLPVTDCVRLMAVRLFRRRSPFSADRNHVHHLLCRLLPDWGALSVYLGFLAAPGLAAEFDGNLANLLLIGCLIAYAGFIWWAPRALPAAGLGLVPADPAE